MDAVRRFLSRRDERIKVKGTDDLLVYRAKCCNPIMGEPIVGYITRGKGVSVHSLSCANVRNLVYDPGRRIEVEWGSGAEGGYEVRLAVDLEDRLGALAAVTAALASMKTDVRDMQVRTFDDNTGSIVLTVRINDLKHLDKVVKSLRGVKGVLDVARQSVSGRAGLILRGRLNIVFRPPSRRPQHAHEARHHAPGSRSPSDPTLRA